jgi:hypothetical protein
MAKKKTKSAAPVQEDLYVVNLMNVIYENMIKLKQEVNHNFASVIARHIEENSRLKLELRRLEEENEELRKLAYRPFWSRIFK